MLLNLNRRLDRSLTEGSPRGGSKKRKLIITGVVVLALLVYLYWPMRVIYSSARSIQINAGAASEAFSNNDLDGVALSVGGMRKAADGLNGGLNWFFWARAIPIVGGYFGDAKHFAKAMQYELEATQVLVDGLAPYKQELGFNGQPTPGQDRVVQVAQMFDKIIPRLDEVAPQLKQASEEVSKIVVAKYPDEVAGRKLRPRVELAKNFITGAYTAVTEARGALEQLPSALGIPNKRKYLIVFQNDKEIRPTGGFMTAYAFLDLDNGRLSSSASDDIYRLDEKLQKVCQSVICPLTPPEPIVKYLPEVDGKPRKSWSMRDSNISPDVPTSLDNFNKFYGFLKDMPAYDGIILIDTKVVEELIKITGSIEVFGVTYSAEVDPRCNCPNVIYELQNYAAVIEKGQEDRKAVLGTLMSQILARSLGAATERFPAFINAGVELANKKHIIFNMGDGKLQSALSKLHWTGEVNQSFNDYLMINDANFAGGKSNLYVKQEVNLDIDTRSNPNKHKLSIKYSNPYAYNTWLNAINRDYVRIYVPKGSKLTGSKGSEVKVTTIEDELGRSVFEAFVTVRPQNSTTIEFEYTLEGNYTKDGKYPILIQKQPGKEGFVYTINVNGQSIERFTLDRDKELNLGV